MTEEIRRKNFLVVEGRLLAEGRQGQLTADEWLALYLQIKDDLEEGPQADLLAALESRIRKRYPKLAMETIAL